MRMTWIVMALLLARERAEALSCVPLEPVLEPSDGEVIPPSATLYLFVHQEHDRAPRLRVTGGGKVIPAVVTPIGDRPQAWGMGAWRVKIEVPAKIGEIIVEGDDELLRRYLVDPRWPAPELDMTYAAHVDRRYFNANSMFDEDALIIVPGQDAPAYRLEWAETRADYVAGKRRRMVLPRSDREFRGSGRRAPPRLTIGHMTCYRHGSMPPDLRPIFIGIQALYPNGTESQLTPDPEMVPFAPQTPAAHRFLERMADPLLFIMDLDSGRFESPPTASPPGR